MTTTNVIDPSIIIIFISFFAAMRTRCDWYFLFCLDITAQAEPFISIAQFMHRQAGRCIVQIAPRSCSCYHSHLQRAHLSFCNTGTATAAVTIITTIECHHHLACVYARTKNKVIMMSNECFEGE